MQSPFNNNIHGSEKQFLIYSTQKYYRQDCEVSLVVIITHIKQIDSLHFGLSDRVFTIQRIGHGGGLSCPLLLVTAYMG